MSIFNYMFHVFIICLVKSNDRYVLRGISGVEEIGELRHLVCLMTVVIFCPKTDRLYPGRMDMAYWKTVTPVQQRYVSRTF